MHRLALLAPLLAGCVLYTGPDGDDEPPLPPPEGAPDAEVADCDRDYVAAIYEPEQGATVTLPVRIRYRWFPDDIPDLYTSLVDEAGLLGPPGTQEMVGADYVTTYDRLEPGLTYTFSLSWVCNGAGGQIIPLASRTFTVAP